MLSVINKISGKCIGYCGFKYCKTLGDVELSYDYSQSVWGKGYGYETAQEVLKYGFEVMKSP